ncbi:MAG TPA: hypothetical protein VEY30_00765 [Myxococcaceae bacterium]|nr:hypothetical protein [Myxococcaceae bacterium]
MNTSSRSTHSLWLTLGLLLGCGGEEPEQSPEPPSELPDRGNEDPPPPPPVLGQPPAAPAAWVNGQLVTSGGGLFLLHNGKKYAFEGASTLASAYGLRTRPRILDRSVLDAIPAGGSLGYPEGTALRAPGTTKVYVVDLVGAWPDAVWMRRWVRSTQALAQCGFRHGDIIEDRAIEDPLYQDGPDITGCTDATLPDGVLITGATGSLYRVRTDDATGARLRDRFLRGAISTYGYKPEQEQVLSQANIEAYAEGVVIGRREGVVFYREDLEEPVEYSVVDRSGPQPVRRTIPNEPCYLLAYGLAERKDSGELNFFQVYSSMDEPLEEYLLGEPLPDVCTRPQ